jgi:hypothetical protein
MEAFCNTELTYLLRRMPQHCFLGGNCNCVTPPHNRTNDCQQHTWCANSKIQYHSYLRTYTHYSPTSETHLDRIEPTPTLARHKIRKQIIVEPFTDHLAVTSLLNLGIPLSLSSGLWILEMNISFLDDKNVLDRFKHRWTDWRRWPHHYKNHTQWLESYIKHQIQNFSPTKVEKRVLVFGE